MRFPIGEFTSSSAWRCNTCGFLAEIQRVLIYNPLDLLAQPLIAYRAFTRLDTVAFPTFDRMRITVSKSWLQQ